MSRNHGQLMRGMSSDERIKTKTKKAKNGQRRHEYNPLKTQNMETRNIDLLLNIANSISQFADRQTQYRFKSSDLKVLQLIILQLNLVKRLEEYQKIQNRQKIKQLKNHIDHIRQKINQMVSQSERINLLIRSGSPKNRKPIIACEMSPPMNNPIGGLIQRKIEEDNRQRTTFQTLKKRDQCFIRLFENIQKIAQKLNIPKSDKAILTFKGYISKIESSIQAIISRQIQFKNILKDFTSQQQIILKLRQQNQLLKNKNEALINQISNIQQQNRRQKQQLNEKIKQMNIKYIEIQQDFNLIAKQKLDAETAYSKIYHQSQKLKDKYEKRVRNLQMKVSQILKQEVQELKNTQNILKKQAMQYRFLSCQAVQKFNTIIYRYTKQLKAISTKQNKLKKQIIILQNDKIQYFEENKNKLQKMKNIIENQYNQKIYKKNRLSIYQYFNHILKPLTQKTLSLHQLSQISYSPLKQYSQASTQTQIQISKQSQFKILSHIIEIQQNPRNIFLNIEKSYQIIIKSKKTFSCKEIQTKSQYNEQIKTKSDMQVQTANIIANMFTQTLNQTSDIASQSNQITLSKSNNIYEITISLQQQVAFGIQTQRKQLQISNKFNDAIFPFTIQSNQVGINTDTIEIQAQVSEIQNHEQTLLLSQKKKQYLIGQDNIFQLLVEAQQCINIPQISVLRQQISIYLREIQNLKQQLSHYKKQKQNEQQNIFQFCY